MTFASLPEEENFREFLNNFIEILLLLEPNK
jgi:hypothetical protein